MHRYRSFLDVPKRIFTVVRMELEISYRQGRAFVIALTGAAFVALSYWWLSQPGDSPAPVVSVVPTAQVGSVKVVVDVQGEVRSPGVVELPVGSRVRDAVAAAGGLRPGATAGTNLARRVEDGEQILIGRTAEVSLTSSDGRIRINSATQAQLEDLPGVGPVLASRLIDYRTAHGRFRNLASLDAVSGVGPAMLANLKDAVSFD